MTGVPWSRRDLRLNACHTVGGGIHWHLTNQIMSGDVVVPAGNKLPVGEQHQTIVHGIRRDAVRLQYRREGAAVLLRRPGSDGGVQRFDLRAPLCQGTLPCEAPAHSIRKQPPQAPPLLIGGRGQRDPGIVSPDRIDAMRAGAGRAVAVATERRVVELRPPVAYNLPLLSTVVKATATDLSREDTSREAVAASLGI